MEKLPLELVIYIKKFVFIKCCECKNEIIDNNILKNVTTTYYKNIFDDDYPFPRIHKTYKYLCNKCVLDLKKEKIIPL